MIKMVSSRVKMASEAYDAMRRIGESVRRANPKDRCEFASSIEMWSRFQKVMGITYKNLDSHKTWVRSRDASCLSISDFQSGASGVRQEANAVPSRLSPLSHDRYDSSSPLKIEESCVIDQ